MRCLGTAAGARTLLINVQAAAVAGPVPTGMELSGPATKKKEEKMAREYVWTQHGEDCAVLCGPEPYMVAALVRLDRGDPEQPESCWRIMSGIYSLLNQEEKDSSIPLEDMKRRTLLLLMQELAQKIKDTDEDLVNVRSLLFADMSDDPYM